MKKKIMLLGSGELGKEFVIAAQRFGQYIIAVDSYAGAPAMQVADDFEVINMLNGEELDAIVTKHQPDIIVPEIEAIRTERFYDYEKGFEKLSPIQVVPSAKAANFTMNRKAIRDLAAKTLNVKTANYAYASTEEQVYLAIEKVGFPCVVKPLMSSSGKGQSVAKNKEEAIKSFHYALENSRGDIQEVIFEAFIDFQYEITLLTITQKNGETLFCPPIGHRQESGDYRESWQPAIMKTNLLEEAKEMAKKVTKELGGEGIWGVEFFIGENEVYFSELSPRPHDTGMVTLANNLNFNEFELHLRSVLGLPIPQISIYRHAASAVVLAEKEGGEPKFYGIEKAMMINDVDVKVFGKPSTRKNRRMAVVLCSKELGYPIEDVVKIAKAAADLISVVG
jgi:phosphoribosylglycinamide formyltransferase 2